MLNTPRTLRNTVAIAYAAFALSSCDKTENTPAQPYDDGVFVINEGNFSDNNGTLSLVLRDSKTVSYDIFQKENTRSLAGGVAGYAEVDEKGIILVDNTTAGKDALEIVNAHTFKTIATIKDDIENPRDVAKVGTNKAYVTCWGTNADYSYKTAYVAVVDLTTNKVTKKIPLGIDCESIMVIGNNAFIGTIYNGQKNLNIIDTQKDELTSPIEIGTNPGNFVLDASNKIWMIAGKEIVLFNPTTKLVESRLKAGAIDKTPNSLSISQDKKTLYYTYNSEIYSLNIADGSTKTFIKRKFTSVGFDNESNQVYTTLIPSYKQAGYIFRYQSNGTLIDSVKTEIAPVGFFFK